VVVLTKHIHKIFIFSISFGIFNKDFHVQKNRDNSRETGSCTKKFLSMSRLRRLVNLETSFKYNAVATPGRKRRAATRRKKRV